MKVLTPDLKEKAWKILQNYDDKRAALLPLLRLIQETHGFISAEAEQETAEFIGIPEVDVREVMTFYSLFHSKPCAKHQLNICRTLSCSLLGGEEMIRYLEEKLGIRAGEQSSDGKYGLHTVECLGACEIAPMMQVGKEYVGQLTKEKIDRILRDLD